MMSTEEKFIQAVPLEDQAEVRKFVEFLRRRAERPDEPTLHSYAEIYGEVVYEVSELPGAKPRDG